MWLNASNKIVFSLNYNDATWYCKCYAQIIIAVIFSCASLTKNVNIRSFKNRLMKDHWILGECQTIGLGCGNKAECPHVGTGPKGWVSFVGVFLGDPIPYLRNFGENHGKLRMARSTSATGDWIYQTFRMWNLFIFSEVEPNTQ